MDMRVMVMVKATKDIEKGVLPEPELFEAMGRFNEALVNAGVLLAGDGLTPSSRGKRVTFDGASRAVIDGPFAETRELVAGFSLWEVKDMDEALAWVKRCPNPMPGPCEIEIRPLFEMADFAESLTPEFKQIRGRVSEKLSGKLGPAGAFGGLGT
ncbi:MAG: YciI family protein [Caulobacteraceae bacterium]